MSLILAIEPDRRQAAKVYALADTLRVELIHGETTETALAALGTRQPDLVLTSQLLSPKDEAALADRLRELDAAGAHVATLVIPVLRGEEGEKKKKGGLFGRLRRSKDEKTTEGCEPSVFGMPVFAVGLMVLASDVKDKVKDAGWIEQLYVAPGRTGEGIGARLLALAQGRAGPADAMDHHRRIPRRLWPARPACPTAAGGPVRRTTASGAARRRAAGCRQRPGSQRPGSQRPGRWARDPDRGGRR